MKPRPSNAVRGAIVGAMLGALSGLGTAMWLIGGTRYFPWDAMLLGSVICGLAGYRFGEPFFEWLDQWWTDIVL